MKMNTVRKFALIAGLMAFTVAAAANDKDRDDMDRDDEQSYETEHEYDRGKDLGRWGQPRELTIKIVALNDFHGQLLSPGSFSSIPAGGVDAVAAHVARFKTVNPRTVVVSAGDLIGATPLVSALFHDEGTIETMNRVGLDYNAVGNHEFDEGRNELLRMQRGGCNATDTNTCKGADVGTPVPFEGADFRFLAANVVDTKTGRTLLAPYGIKRFGKTKIAFIGMTLKETPTIVTPSGVAGLSFKDEIETVNALVPRLRRRGVEAIVVLLHQGGFQGSTAPNFINDCSASLQNDTSSPIRRIVRGFDDAVDLVVSGHTHTGYNCMLPNKAGRLIRVTQASSIGRVLTDIDMRVDTRTGHVLDTTANNVIVDRTVVTPDAAIAGIVQGYSALVSPLSNAVVGTSAAALPNTANPAGEMLAGKLIADAQLAATSSPATGSAEVAFQNAGGVRNPGFIGASYPDDITYGEAFTVQPFGNSMVTLTLTNQQIRDLLEQQFAGCNGQTVQRIMQVSAGFSYSWSVSGTCGTRIVNVSLNGTPVVSAGVVQNPAATHRVTVNNFMATGGDGYSVLLGGTNQLGGPQDIDALIAYLAAYKAPNAPYDPAVFPARITQLP
jgi:5'-nucleotidase